MNLMISDSALQPMSATTQADAGVETLSFATGECSLGQVLIARSAWGVCAILIGDSRGELMADVAVRFPEARLVANEGAVRDDLANVISFVDKPAKGLNLSLDMRGTPFQCRVWEKLRAIPVGRMVTYTELARWVGPLTTARAVAGACAANPLALAVPCHRVQCSNGDLGGYRWGVGRKSELIKREAMA